MLVCCASGKTANQNTVNSSKEVTCCLISAMTDLIVFFHMHLREQFLNENLVAILWLVNPYPLVFCFKAWIGRSLELHNTILHGLSYQF